MRSEDIAAQCREIAVRVRNSGEWGELADTLEHAAGEIEQLREGLRMIARADGTASVCDGNITVTRDTTLTDEEREAIEIAIPWIDGMQEPKVVDTLRSLLERTK